MFVPLQPRRPPPNHQTQALPTLKAWGVLPTDVKNAKRTRVQPYGGSYFLPGKLAGKTATFLLNSGCTTNLLSRRLFDTLSTRDRASLELYQGENDTLVNGSCILFYCIIEQTGRVWDQMISKTFIGMPFLLRHKCHIDFSKSAVGMPGRGLAYVNKFGWLLVRGAQVVRNCSISRCFRATIHCRVNCKQISKLRVLDCAHERIQLANSLNELDMRGRSLHSA